MKGSNIREAGNREAVLLEQENIRVLIDADKGMIPELSTRKGDAWVNAHWQPWFRANSGESWDASRHEPFWKVPLLYDIAGSFPCVPNFGPDHRMDSYELPPHGFTARQKWTQDTPVCLEENRGIALSSTLPRGEHPFAYKKTDLLLKGENVHYAKLEIRNTGSREEPYNCGWHNTCGAPFLESGCLIDNNAEQYAVPPEGGEFDPTGELAFEGRSESLEQMPLRRGGSKDMRLVEGPSGYTDFICGAVPSRCELGWSSIVNPCQKLIYLSFFTGPSAVSEEEIPLYFYDLWLNYGGRDYQPWAVQDGQSDQTFCLGAENATGYFANGLAEAVKNPTLMGNPTHLILPAGQTRTNYYGTLFQGYEGDALDLGIRSVDCGEGELILTGYTGKSVSVKAEWDFKTLKSI